MRDADTGVDGTPKPRMKASKMRILVTGGAGFIGSHVVETYLEDGHDIVVVDDLSSGHPSNLAPAAKFYEFDIASPELFSVFERERPDIVSHHAAHVSVRRSVSDPVRDARINVLGSLNVLECARQSGTQRVIYASSGGAVYGEPDSLPCDENHAVHPICPYGVSKHAVEHYLAMYSANYGLDYIVLRYGNVYGPRQDPMGEAGVVAIFAGQMLKGEQVVINGDGEQERDFVYVGDCAEANRRALTTSRANTIYNLGTGVGTSVNHIFTALQTITGYRHSPVYGPAMLGETRRIYLDTSKAARALGWSPKVTLEEGLERTVDHFRDLAAL
jgi:UDP-glucose 4-epimerase